MTWSELIPTLQDVLAIGRIDTIMWGELIPLNGASWYHDLGWVDTGRRHYAKCLPLGRVNTMTWASWYYDVGRVDTITWGKLILALCEVISIRASWYHDVGRVIFGALLPPTRTSDVIFFHFVNRLFVIFTSWIVFLKRPARRRIIGNPCKKAKPSIITAQFLYDSIKSTAYM
jgi:hypothetical protein